jgi:hypothetical protein
MTTAELVYCNKAVYDANSVNKQSCFLVLRFLHGVRDEFTATFRKLLSVPSSLVTNRNKNNQTSRLLPSTDAKWGSSLLVCLLLFLFVTNEDVTHMISKTLSVNSSCTSRRNPKAKTQHS